MDITAYPGRIKGKLRAIGSKSEAHRLLILSSLCATPTRVICRAPSRDVMATADCLNSICAKIENEGGVFTVTPETPAKSARLRITESAGTYRFLLPLTMALGVKTEFVLGERLARRPVKELIEALTHNGADAGGLSGGEYDISGDISSQFVSGLCMALPLLKDDSVICIKGELQSRGYVEMTLEALEKFGIRERFSENRIYVKGGGAYQSPGEVTAGGDWSSAAMFLCAAAASGSEVSISGLDRSSRQPDRAITDILKSMGANIYWNGLSVRVSGGKLKGRVINVSDTPDIAPALAIAAVAAEGETTLTGTKRLRFKESDRISAIVAALNSVGATSRARGDDIVIKGTGAIAGGEADSAGDHRIAMMLGCMAALAKGPIIIRGAQAVGKSYPSFYEDLRSLGIDVREVCK